MTLSVPQRMTSAVGTQAHVVRTEWLSPSVLRVHLQGPQLVGWRGGPGDKIKVHVGHVMRSYTPEHVDPARGRVSVVVHVHSADTAGCRWARGLSAGHVVAFFGPARSMPRPTGTERWAAFYGDETTIGVAGALAAALPRGATVVGAIEVAAGDEAAVSALPFDAVTRGRTYGDALVAHANQLAEIPASGALWLSGEATSVLAVRAALLARGVSRSRLRIKPYWSVRGQAHRKSVEARDLSRIARR